MPQSTVLNLIQELSLESSPIMVVWLYGSRAKDTASSNSDYDIAIAFDNNDINFASEYYADELAAKWSQSTGAEISIIDINQVPVPLAYSVIEEGIVVVCKNDLRLHSEQQRIWSLWEGYRNEYRKYRK